MLLRAIGKIFKLIFGFYIKYLLFLIKALTKLKLTSEAAVTYREATRINPFFFEAYKGLVEALLSLNHNKDAIQIAANSVKLLGSNHRTLAVNILKFISHLNKII